MNDIAEPQLKQKFHFKQSSIIMKALVKAKPETGLTLQELPVPSISESEVLIKIRSAAICGTDLHIFDWDNWAASTLKPPVIIGHEFMGEIVKLGSHVKHLKIGDRVSGEGHITCEICRVCKGPKRHLCPNTLGIGIQRDGAFAEFLSLPAGNVVKLPDTLSDEVAAILDPLGNAVHTALSFEMVGESVLITGAGPIGLMATAIAKKVGAKEIIVSDLNEFRLNMALKMGATQAINVRQGSLKEQLKKIKNFAGFKVGLEMSGQGSALQEMIEVMEPGASIALLGIPSKSIELDLNKIIFKGLILKGIYGREMFETWAKMLGLLSAGLDVSPIITHRFHFEDFKNAFETAKSGTAGKVIFHW